MKGEDGLNEGRGLQKGQEPSRANNLKKFRSDGRIYIYNKSEK